MKILYFGDVVAKSGRQAVFDHLPAIRDRLKPDFIIVNGENAAHGFGITAKICDSFFEAGVDAVTTGNHAWDQRDIIPHFDAERRLLRPLNYPAGTPGRGSALFTTARGKKVLVVQVMGRLFMGPIDDPFAAVDGELTKYRLGGGVDAIVVDIHADITSEKMAMGHHLDGRVSLVAGTHSHVPTADCQVLGGGTGYITDIGMCGDYNSVIGFRKETSLPRFTRALPGPRLEPTTGEATACAVFVETDDKTGFARTIDHIRLGGRLSPSLPAQGG